MAILDIKKAMEKDYVCYGSVLINSPPQLRSGKRNDFMVGDFMTPDGTCEFKIWEERTYATVIEHGVGIYDVETCGSEFNGVYLTVRRIQPTVDTSLSVHDFLPAIPRERLTGFWKEVCAKLSRQGVSYAAWKLIEKMLADPELEGRFYVEGAAMYHHDNKVGGLVYHTSKMLNIFSSILENLPQLEKSADLLCMGIIFHDIGKVFEYNNLGLGEYWYANHRVRGIEFLSKYREEIIGEYDEAFYRQLQSIIAGHHGDYGDRPTTVSAAIVHYIDTLESQVTGMIEGEENSPGERLKMGDWGWLQPIPIDPRD